MASWEDGTNGGSGSLWETWPVPSSDGAWEGSNHGRASTDTEARTTHNAQSQIFSLMRIKAEAKEAISLGARQHAPTDHCQH